MAIFKNRKKYTVNTQEEEDIKLKLTKMAKREMILTVVSIFAVLIVSMGSAYAVFTSFATSKDYNKVTVGTLDIVYSAQIGEAYGDKINLSGAYPESDANGKQSTPYKFTITNSGSLPSSYTISIQNDEEMITQDKCSGNQLDKSKIKISINGGEAVSLSSLVDETGKNYILDRGDLASNGASRSYEVRMWITEEAGNEVLGKHFHGKIVIDGNEFRSHDGEPVLSENLIPVKYNGTNWITTTEDDPEWYNYEEREWANAITVREAVRSSYQEKGKEFNFDSENDEVLQMYVWIPRYSYTIKSGMSASAPGAIDIKFIKTGEKDNGSASYTGEKPSEWYTPPGFTFGNKELPGIWIGKFETGSVTGTSPGDVTTDNLVAIKPNITSWRDIRVSTIEEVSIGITKAGNIYGLSSSIYDSHAMKNTEWALVAYLSQSKYGKYGDERYQGANKEIYKNNHSGYQTGCSSGLPTAESSGTCAHTYKEDQAGTGASTTGNIYGIYDMSGGAWEYVMGVLADPDRRSGNTQELNSGYTGKLTDGSAFKGLEWKLDKYYDFYNTDSILTACVIDGNKSNPCKGHALNEIAGWYGDSAWMVGTINPWMGRGGGRSSGAGAGVFNFSYYTGQVESNDSFRLVLTPQ